MEPARNLNTFGLSCGISFFGFGGISGSFSTTRSAVPSRISSIESEENDTVKQLLKNGVANHVILYDDDKDTGWLISYTTLVLFIAQVYLLQAEPLIALPEPLLASNAHDGGESARTTITDYMNGDLSKSSIQSSNLSTESFTKLIKDILHRLCLIQDELRKVYTEARKPGKVAPNMILGVELMDVAKGEQAMPVKRAEVNNPWAHLAEHQPCMVLFCKNLGQAIVPCSIERLCQDWSEVPKGKKYLVATGPTLIRILEKRTRKGVSRLADDVDWTFKSPIVQLHEPGHKTQETQCCHLQMLKSRKPSDDERGLLEAVKAYENGGYIFSNLVKNGSLFG